jgi:UDP-N-acetylmuramate dehydrogenase
MFKNPSGVSAGVLVERTGLRGHALGGARISPVHGNFVENLGSATAADIRGLIELAERRVQEMAGVRLEREVRVWRA